MPCSRAHAVALGATILALALPLIAAAAPPPEPILLASAMQGRQVPAMAVIVIRHGRVDQEAFRGVRNASGTAPVRRGDLWHIGSDAKAMTAAMIARLIERGVFSWDTPLERLLPELAAQMDPGYRNVTLNELLSHRAGLQDRIDSAVLEAFYTDRRPLHAQRLDYVRMALQIPPAFPPGADARYSNRGTIIAALAAERATGLSYEALMRREVFVPLGMRSARFSPTCRGDLVGHEAGKPRFGLHADNPPVDAPAGELRLSMDDWAKFAIDQMRGERGHGKLLTAASYQLLHTGQGGTIYGLGWGVRPVLNGVQGRFLTHGGSNGYWLARIVLEPDTESGFLLAVNTAGADADAAVAAIEGTLTPTLVAAR
jgi:CubicO group peptidase (beta-lactamase class C family)